MGTIRKTSKAGEVLAVIHQFPVARVKASEGGEAEPTDHPGITSSARELNRALGVVDGTCEVRAERVAELRDQIANGAYSPDPRDVAREILKRGL